MDSEQSNETKMYAHLLNQSSQQLGPATKAKLDAARREAMEQFETSTGFFSLQHNFRPAFALATTLIAITGILFLPSPFVQGTTAPDLYADIEILMDQEQLDFLSEMEDLQWDSHNNDS